MDLSSVQAQNEELKATLRNYEEEIKRLNELLRKLRRACFGKKSERIENLPTEQLVFNELEASVKEDPKEDLPKKVITYTRGTGRKKKEPYPEELEREIVIHDLSPSEKVCSTHDKPLKEIKEEVVEKLVTYPARMVIREERTKKYVSSCCETAPKKARVVSILPKTIATPELLSFIVFSKFFQALPLYRLEELFTLHGVTISRGTMARWLISVSEKLRLLWNSLEERLFESGYMGIDATTVQVLKEEGRDASTKSFMWVRGSQEKGIVLLDYNISGAGRVAKNLVAGFNGALQADAHRGYYQLDEDGLTRLGCMMHARRKFYDAVKASSKSTGLAQHALILFQVLYDLDELYKQQELLPEQRYLRRKKEHVPILEQLKTWAQKHKPQVPPSSQIGIALRYLLGEWEYLTRYLENGRYEMDNGWVERVIRKFAIGRNNWLFCNTTEGADSSALLYSLTLTAKLNGKDPFAVMVEIFKRLPEAHTIDDFEALTNLLLCEQKVPFGRDGKPFHYQKTVRCA